MSDRIGVSGCFGDGGTSYPIDDIEEVEAAVSEIVESDTASVEAASALAPNLALDMLVDRYDRRLRLLTWAVVAMAALLVFKELD